MCEAARGQWTFLCGPVLFLLGDGGPEDPLCPRDLLPPRATAQLLRKDHQQDVNPFKRVKMFPVGSRIWVHLSRNPSLSKTPARSERGCDNNWRCCPQRQLPRCPPSRVRHCSKHTPVGRLCWRVSAITEGRKAQRGCSFLAATLARGSCGKDTMASPPKPHAASRTRFWRAAIRPPLRTPPAKAAPGGRRALFICLPLGQAAPTDGSC